MEQLSYVISAWPFIVPAMFASALVILNYGRNPLIIGIPALLKLFLVYLAFYAISFFAEIFLISVIFPDMSEGMGWLFIGFFTTGFIRIVAVGFLLHAVGVVSVWGLQFDIAEATVGGGPWQFFS
ncbi:MAG: hypothetical protein ACKVP7_21900 [Hyphomicrobiaceae bacterium]